MIEFALVLPFLLLVVLGMLDVGKAMNYRNDLTHLANEAARYAAVSRNPGPEATLEESIEQQAASGELRSGGESITAAIDVTICYPPGSSGAIGDPIKVTADATYRFLDFLSSGRFHLPTNVTMTGTSIMRLEKPYSLGSPPAC